MENQITSEFKDSILSELVKKTDRFSHIAYGSEFSIPDALMGSIMSQFERKRLITILQSFPTGLAYIRVEIEADEFLANGGFITEHQMRCLILNYCKF